MRFAIIGLLAVLCSAATPVLAKDTAPAPTPAAAADGFANEDQKTFYALGMIMGRQTKVFNMTKSELAFVHAGLSDEIENNTRKVDVDTYGPKVQQLAQARMAVVSEANKQKGVAYLAQAEKESGMVKLPSGVLVKTLKEGTGAVPTATNKVKVHYRGTTIDGTEFDSSYKRGQSTEFGLNEVVQCWTQGVQKMKVGGKAKLVCPAATAYGEQGAPGLIPPHSTLIFEIELLEVVKA